MLAQQVLSDYLQQVADEELLSRSARAARRARFKTDATEEIVRRYRRRKVGAPLVVVRKQRIPVVIDTNAFVRDISSEIGGRKSSIRP